jgi:hypothetical protein
MDLAREQPQIAGSLKEGELYIVPMANVLPAFMAFLKKELKFIVSTACLRFLCRVEELFLLDMRTSTGIKVSLE